MPKAQGMRRKEKLACNIIIGVGDLFLFTMLHLCFPRRMWDVLLYFQT